MKIDRKKRHFQKRLVLLNLKELHVEFTTRYCRKIGLSKFCELRPKWCIPIGGASGPHAVCVCELHQNVNLLVSQIPEVTDYKTKLSKVICDTAHCACILHGCDNCPGSSALKEYHTGIFDEHETDNITFKQWLKSNFKCTLYPIFLPAEEFIDEVCHEMEALQEHHFIAKSQAAYLQHLKSSLQLKLNSH